MAPVSRIAEIEKRKRLFAKLNALITERGGWLVSIPGDLVMRFEALEGSSLPDELRKLGYDVSAAGTTTRILPVGHVETLVPRIDGGFDCVAEGSTKGLRIHHAGIVKTAVFELIPPAA